MGKESILHPSILIQVLGLSFTIPNMPSQYGESSFIPLPVATDNQVFVSFRSRRKQNGSEKNCVQKVTSPKERLPWQDLRNRGLLRISVQQQTPDSGKCSKFLSIFLRNFSVYTFFLICTKLTQILMQKTHPNSLDTFHTGKCSLEHSSYPSLSPSSSS